MKTRQVFTFSALALVLSTGLAEGQVCSVRFEPAVSSATGGAFANSLRDMTGDGGADLVASDYFQDRVRVMRASEMGLLIPHAEIPVILPNATEVADFDGNSIPDVAALSDILWLHSSALGLGGGFFAPPVSLGHPFLVGGIASADFNLDHAVDLALSWRAGTYQIRLLDGDGAGGFANGGDLAVSGFTFAPELLAGEFTGDSAPDIAAFYWSDSLILVYPNLAGSGFGPPIASTAGFSTAFERAADLDGDGDLDLVGTDRDGASVRILLSLNGSFVEAASLPAPDISSRVAIADFDHDGRYDLAYATLGGEIRVLRGLSPTSFEPLASWTGPSGSSRVLVGDVDGDGWIDVARQAAPWQTVEVSLNRGCSVIEIPTLDRTGLAALAGLLAVAACMLLRGTSSPL